jgi:hypothetical protein
MSIHFQVTEAGNGFFLTIPDQGDRVVQSSFFEGEHDRQDKLDALFAYAQGFIDGIQHARSMIETPHLASQVIPHKGKV